MGNSKAAVTSTNKNLRVSDVDEEKRLHDAPVDQFSCKGSATEVQTKTMNAKETLRLGGSSPDRIGKIFIILYIAYFCGILISWKR